MKLTSEEQKLLDFHKRKASKSLPRLSARKIKAIKRIDEINERKKLTDIEDDFSYSSPKWNV